MAAVTMTMVASEAGVSISTVSHVINGTRPVAPETRRAVLDAMTRLGFEHKPVSRSLSAGSSVTIGLAISSIANPFWLEIAAGIDEECSRQGFQVLMSDTRDDPDQEERVVANLLAHHVRGLIIAPTSGWQDKTLRLLREHPIPYVILDRVLDLRADQIGVENEGGAAALVDHLLSRGHRRIGMIAGLEGISTSTERLAGYVKAHQRRNVPVDRALIVDGGSSEDGGRRAAAQILAMNPRPTALFVANDGMTIGALRALRSAKVRVPHDMAVVMFDDFAWSDAFEPQMTALAQPCFALGARAVQLLDRRVKDPQAPPQTLRLAGELVHRTSCGCGLSR